MTSTLPPRETYSPDGEVRRVPSSVGRPLDPDRVADAILAALIGHGVDRVALGPRGDAYTGDAVLVPVSSSHAGIPFAWRYPHGLHRRIAAWVAEHAPEVTAITSPARYFHAQRTGNGYIRLQVVDAFSSAELDRAITAARVRGTWAWAVGPDALLDVVA